MQGRGVIPRRGGNMGLGADTFAVASAQTSIPPKFQHRLKDMFAYVADFLPLTASLTQTQPISIQSDSDFVIVAGVAVVTDTANAVRITFVPQLVQLQDQGSGRNLFSSQTHFNNVFGTAEEPAYWPQPKVLIRGSTFAVQLQNLEATNRNVRIAFMGFKVFDMDENQA
jgi:hypothetical protein